MDAATECNIFPLFSSSTFYPDLSHISQAASHQCSILPFSHLETLNASLFYFDLSNSLQEATHQKAAAGSNVFPPLSSCTLCLTFRKPHRRLIRQGCSRWIQGLPSFVSIPAFSSSLMLRRKQDVKKTLSFFTPILNLFHITDALQEATRQGQSPW